MNDVTEDDFLTVSESFVSIQGEGETMGVPAVFLRLAGCNLLCEGSGWICDTIEVWRKGERQAFNEVLIGDAFDRLRGGYNLVITGGEPLLWQNKLERFLIWFNAAYGWLPIIEVETNGTIEPSAYLLATVDHWNCSPKLANSGETVSRRIKASAVSRISNFGKSAIFKFVITGEADVKEALRDYGSLVALDSIYLMPAGSTQAELNTTRRVTAEAAIKYGLHYSDRLHIAIWNEKTGV